MLLSRLKSMNAFSYELLNQKNWSAISNTTLLIIKVNPTLFLVCFILFPETNNPLYILAYAQHPASSIQHPASSIQHPASQRYASFPLIDTSLTLINLPFRTINPLRQSFTVHLPADQQ